MPVKIGLIGDVHATPAPLAEALALFKRAGVETTLCAGDVAGYGTKLLQTVELLINSNCRVVLGNHDLWQLSCPDGAESLAEVHLRTLPRFFECSFEDKNISMVHASPPDSVMNGIKLLDDKATIIPEQKQFWSDYFRALSL